MSSVGLNVPDPRQKVAWAFDSRSSRLSWCVHPEPLVDPLCLARITLEPFCCTRRSAVPTTMRSAGRPFRSGRLTDSAARTGVALLLHRAGRLLDGLHEHTSVSPGASRRSHDAARRFRNEPS